LFFAEEMARAFADEAATPPKQEEQQHLGCQAAQRIEAATDPIAMLADLTSVFPSIAKALSGDDIDKGVCKKFARNREMIGLADGYMLINGLCVRTRN
jgi:hypothetical protein